MAERKFILYSQRENNKKDTSNSEVVNMKTMLEIANDLGVDKQKVYRCVKKNDIAHSQIKDDKMYYDEAAQTCIKSLLEEKSTTSKNTNEAAQIIDKSYHEVVMKQLDTIIQILQRQLDIQEMKLQKRDQEIERLKKIIDQKNGDSQ